MVVAARRLSSGRFGGAFTLVELLVVIGVISVLAGLLLPSLARAKNAAQKVHCQSSLKQWGLALLLYLDDFRCYPPAFLMDPTGAIQGPEHAVATYFSSQARNAAWEMRCRQKWIGQGVTYRYNELARTVQPHSPYLGLGGEFVRQNETFSFEPLPESGVKVPDDTIAFTESVFSRDPRLGGAPVTQITDLIGDFPRTGEEDFYPHDRGLNQVFCDGHVQEVLRRHFASRRDEIRRRWFIDHQPHPEFWP